MSEVIDQKVVQMKFDNRQFESGVSTTMASLDKFKKSLDFDNSTKGLNKLDEASKKIDFSSLNNAAETVTSKISAWGIMGITALSNLTNSAINSGKKIVSAFTIDPIKTGFQEYETQINSVQTILANTESKGSTLQDVNAALDELNTYADKTIYNFTEMTRNIGTFTAAGVDLDTSVSAIKGIANLAAVSGSTSQQASTAMYQLSQALSSGTVKLQDWNSVVNAGMGGQVFQDALKETARVHGIAIDSMIKSEGSFRETLKDGWLTSDILTETLNKFTGDLNAEQLKTMGYTDQQIEEIVKMGKTANDAATKVKTFTQLFDTLKEAAQSGWTQSWETIIGDFEEAKSLFTEMSDTLGALIGASADARNNVLVSGLGSGWEQFLDQGIDDAEGYKETAIAVAKSHGIAIDDMIKSEGSFEDTLKSGWLTNGLMKESLAQLTEKTKGLTDKQLEEIGYTRDQVNSLEKLNDSVKNGTISVEHFADQMTNATGRENLIQSLRNAFKGLMSVIEPVSRAFKEIFPPITGEQLYAFTEGLKNLTAKFELSTKESVELKHAFKGLFAVVDIIGQAFAAVFTAVKPLISGFSKVNGGILETAASFGDWLVSLDESIRESNAFGKAIENVVSFVKNISNYIKAAGEFIYSGLIRPMKEFFAVINQKINFSGFDFFNDILNKVKERMSEVKGATVNMKDAMSNAFIGISEAISASKIVQVFKSIYNGVKIIVTGLISALGELADGAINILGSADFNGLLDLVNSGLIAGIAFGIKKLIDSFSDVAKDGKGFIDSISDIKDAILDTFGAVQSQLKAGTLQKIAVAIGILAASLFVISLIDSEKLADSLGAVTVLFTELMGSMSIFGKISDGLGATSGACKSMISMSVAVLILSAALKQISSLNFEELAVGLTGITVLTGEMVATAKVMGNKASNIEKGAGQMLILSVALKVLASVCEDLAKLSWAELAKGLAGVGILMAEISLFLSKTKFDGKAVSASIGILIMSAAINVLASACSDFGNMDLEQLLKGLGSIGILLAELAVFTKLTGNAKNVISTGVALVLIGTSIKILASALTDISKMSLEELAKGLTGMAVSLGAITLALNLMPKDSTLKSISLIAVAGALLILADALTNMGQMSGKEIAKSLITLAASLAIIAGAMALMTGALPGAAALLVIATALRIFAPVLQNFGNMSLAEIGKGLLALAGVFTVFGVAGLVLGPLTPVLIALGAAVALLGVGCMAAGAGIMLFSVGITALAAAGTAGSAALVIAITSILSLIPLAMKKLGEGVVAFADVVKDGIPAIVDAVKVLLLSLIDAIDTVVPPLVKTFINLITVILSELAAHTFEWVDSLMKIIVGLIKGLADNIQPLVEATIDLVINTIRGIIAKIADIIQVGIDFIIALINGIADGIRNNTGRFVEAMTNLGTAIIEGLIDGIKAGIKGIKDIGSKIGDALMGGTKESLDIHSPSKKMARLGMYAIQGFKDGFSSGAIAMASYVEKTFKLSLLNPIDRMTYKANKLMADCGLDRSSEKLIKQVGRNMDYGSGAMKGFLKQYCDLTDTVSSDSSTILLASNAVTAYGKSLYKESTYYKEDTKNIQTHKKELIDLQKTRSELTQKLTEANSKNTDESKKQAKQITSDLEKVDSKIEDSKKQIIEDESTVLEHTKQVFNDLKDSVKDGMKDTLDILSTSIDTQINLFEKFNSESDITAKDILENMNSQVVGINKWNSDLQTLSDRGLSEGILKQLRELGPSGSKYVSAFVSMTSEELNRANKSFEASAKMTSDTLIRNFDESLKDTNQWVNDLQTLAEKGLNQGIIESLGKAGVDSADYIEAFINMTPDQIADINAKYEKSLALPETAANKVIATFVYAGTKSGEAFVDGVSIGVEESSKKSKSASKSVSDNLENEKTEVVSTSEAIGKSSEQEITKYVSEDSGKKYGEELCVGIATGIKESTPQIKTAINNMGKAITNAMKSVLTDDITNPKITPVIDLSNVNSGVKSLNSLINTDKALDITSTISGVTPPSSDNQPSTTTTSSTQYIQNNYSPKALSNNTIYRQTKNILKAVKGLNL